MSMVFSGTSTFSSLTPLASPFWSSSSDLKCGAVVVDPDTNIQFCCDGLLIDLTQPITGTGADQHPYYFENLRCCSGVGVALGDVTTCGGATQVTLTEQLSTSTISGSITVAPVTAASTSERPITATEIIATASPPSGSTATTMPADDTTGDQPNDAFRTWKTPRSFVTISVVVTTLISILY